MQFQQSLEQGCHPPALCCPPLSGYRSDLSWQDAFWSSGIYCELPWLHDGIFGSLTTEDRYQCLCGVTCLIFMGSFFSSLTPSSSVFYSMFCKITLMISSAQGSISLSVSSSFNARGVGEVILEECPPRILQSELESSSALGGGPGHLTHNKVQDGWLAGWLARWLDGFLKLHYLNSLLGNHRANLLQHGLPAHWTSSLSWTCLWDIHVGRGSPPYQNCQDRFHMYSLSCLCPMYINYVLSIVECRARLHNSIDIPGLSTHFVLFCILSPLTY